MKKIGALFLVAILLTVIITSQTNGEPSPNSPVSPPPNPCKRIITLAGPFIYDSRTIEKEIVNNGKTGWTWVVPTTEATRYCDYIGSLDGTPICTTSHPAKCLKKSYLPLIWK